MSSIERWAEFDERRKHNSRLANVRFGAGAPLFLIAGPCVIESEGHALMMAEKLGAVASELGVPYVFKASYDKANRSSVSSYRGPGLKNGLKILAKIKKKTGLPVLTDVHQASEVEAAAEVCDILQIPAFLSRQTDLLVAAGEIGARGEYQEGAISFACGDGERGGESGEHGERENYSDGAREFVWVSESCG